MSRRAPTEILERNISAESKGLLLRSMRLPGHKLNSVRVGRPKKVRTLYLGPLRGGDAKMDEYRELMTRYTGDDIRIVRSGKWFEIQRWTGSRWVRG